MRVPRTPRTPPTQPPRKAAANSEDIAARGGGRGVRSSTFEHATKERAVKVPATLGRLPCKEALFFGVSEQRKLDGNSKWPNMERIVAIPHLEEDATLHRIGWYTPQEGFAWSAAKAPPLLAQERLMKVAKATGRLWIPDRSSDDGLWGQLRFTPSFGTTILLEGNLTAPDPPWKGHGLSVVSEDTWGGEITTATLSHLAASTPPEYLYNTTDLHNYNVEHTGKPAPETRDGKLYASDEPGLGVEPDLDELGDPVAIYGE